MKKGLILVAALAALVLVASSVIVGFTAPGLIAPALLGAGIILLGIAAFARAVVIMRGSLLKRPLRGLHVASPLIKLTGANTRDNYASITTATATSSITGGAGERMTNPYHGAAPSAA